MAAKASKTGPGPKVEELIRSGKLKVHEGKTYEEIKSERVASGRKLKEKPAYLLPDDHFRKRKRYSVTLAPDARAIAKKIGNGNVSGGIERALLHYFDCPRTDRRRRK